jgi:hypothetical protein
MELNSETATRFSQQGVEKGVHRPGVSFLFCLPLALPILVGHTPKLMSTCLIGSVTLGYVFALSQFVAGVAHRMALPESLLQN